MKRHNTMQTHKQTAARTYRFCFGTDEYLYTFSFKGSFPEPEIHRMLEAAHSVLYAECGKAVQSYLDSHHLEYTDFCSCRTLLEHNALMAAASRLLYDASPKELYEQAGDAGEFYAVIDHQKQTDECCCEGCCLALSGTSSVENASHEYHVIGQTFRCDDFGNNLHSYFAIRRSQDKSCLNTLNVKDGCPVIATYGCVDMMALLLNINSITTLEQASELANK